MPEADSAALSAALSEFNIQADDFGVDEKSFGYCYWRNRDTGYITIGPAWGTEYKRQQKKRMEPLDEYGEFHFPYDKTNKWWPSREPYFLLFLKGGAKEFCERQVREHGWDRKPPYRGVRFSQLSADPEEVACPYCYKKLPRLPEARRLLQNHIQVMHKENAQSKQMSDAFAAAQARLQGQVAEPQAKLMALIVEGMQTLARAQAEQAERQRAADERMALLFEKVLGQPASVSARAEEALPAPAEVPAVELEAVTFVGPGAEEEVPVPGRRRK